MGEEKAGTATLTPTSWKGLATKSGRGGEGRERNSGEGQGWALGWAERAACSGEDKDQVWGPGPAG